MPQTSIKPTMKIPLGLKPSLGITYAKLLKRSRRRLQLLHSGQWKVDYLVNADFLQGAFLTVENDEFVLVAPIHGPVHPDLFGYPSDVTTSLASDATNMQPGGESAAKELTERNKGCRPSEEVEQDLDAALDAVSAGDPGLASDAPWPGPSQQSSLEADRLAVDQLLGCAEASSRMLSAMVEICDSSDDVIADTRRLERLTGLNSAPARSYIAAREPELVADIDGYRVPFYAPAVRNVAADQEVVRIQVQLLSTKAESDVLRAEVTAADGNGVPGGVATLGQHDMRFVGLQDWQRGTLLILRGAGVPLNLAVTEAISTARLVRRPALVVDPGDWAALRRAAVNALAVLDERKADVQPNDAGADRNLAWWPEI